MQTVRTVKKMNNFLFYNGKHSYLRIVIKEVVALVVDQVIVVPSILNVSIGVLLISTRQPRRATRGRRQHGGTVATRRSRIELIDTLRVVRDALNRHRRKAIYILKDIKAKAQQIMDMLAAVQILERLNREENTRHQRGIDLDILVAILIQADTLQEKIEVVENLLLCRSLEAMRNLHTRILIAQQDLKLVQIQVLADRDRIILLLILRVLDHNNLNTARAVSGGRHSGYTEKLGGAPVQFLFAFFWWAYQSW